MSDTEFYKPHIRVKIYADVPSQDVINLYPPIIINKYPDDLELSCTLKRDCLQGNFALTLLLDVVNLNSYIKWQMLNQKYRYMVVYAGYLGSDYYDTENKDNYIDSHLKVLFKGYIVWMGTIVEARKKVTTRFLSVQNPAESLTANTETMSIRFNAGYNLYQLINDMVRIAGDKNVKLNLAKEDLNQDIDTDVKIDNFNRKSLDSILNMYGITIAQGFDMTENYITEQTYIEMNSEKKAPNDDENVVIVDEDHGLINIPTLQTSGNYPTLRFKMLFNSKVRTFNYVKLRSSDVQLPTDVSSAEDVPDVANSGIFLDYELDDEGRRTGWGYYLVLTITYSMESRGGNFTQEIEASPYNIYNKILNGEGEEEE